MIAEEATETDLIDAITNFDLEEATCFFLAREFLLTLKESELPDFEDLKKLVLEERIQDWGDFKLAQEYVKELKDCGLSSAIEFNEKKDVAWLKVFKEVNNGFIINNQQDVRANYVTLVRNLEGEWRVFAIGGAKVNPFKSNNLFETTN